MLKLSKVKGSLQKFIYVFFLGVTYCKKDEQMNKTHTMCELIKG